MNASSCSWLVHNVRHRRDPAFGTMAWAGARRLLRGVIVAGILAAIFAQPVLVPYCSWSELDGYCYPGDDGGCVWTGDGDVCW